MLSYICIRIKQSDNFNQNQVGKLRKIGFESNDESDMTVKGRHRTTIAILAMFFHQSRLKLNPIKIFTIWFSIVRSSDVVVVGSMKCLFNMKGGIHTIKSLWRWILWKTSNRVKIQIWWDSAQVQPLCFVRMFGLWWFWKSCSSQRPAGGATKFNIYWNG